jgi:predicted MFS family arabinose efflux permease
MQGLSVLQISILLSWWAGVGMIAEIPSGALADYWSRQKLLVIAPLIKSFCFIVWYFAGGSFYLYALGFLCWSLGSSLRSGTTEALLYDHLVFFNKRDDYEKVLGRKKFYFYLALMGSVISGGFIAHYRIAWAILLSVVPLLFSAFFAARLVDVPKTETTGETRYLEHLTIAFREIRTNQPLRYILMYALGISIFGDLEEFDQLYYEFVNLPMWAFGIVGSIGSLLNAFSSQQGYRLKEKPFVHYVGLFSSAGCLGMVGIFPRIPIILLLLLSYVLVEPLNVIIESRLQHSIRSVSRATITSVNTFLISLVGIVTTPIFGLISKIWNFQAIYLCSCGYLVLLTLWVFLKRRILLSQAKDVN